MSQASKAELWKELKDAGVEFPLHYREYNTAQLQAAVDKLRGVSTGDPQSEEQPPVEFSPENFRAAMQDFADTPQQAAPTIPVTSEKSEHAGMQFTAQAEDEPIRIDPETGFIWYRDEVRKAAFPKPRGRKVVKYNDPGVKTVTQSNGQYTESFELPGDNNRPSEARITLPSYQVGLYRQSADHPFRTYVYNEAEGYHLFDVENYYGGAERVPASVKRIYVSTELCYDIRSVHQAIESEYRERVLGKPTL